MAQWEGKSKGLVLGYRIFIFFIKNIGIRAAYLLLVPVSLYFFIFAPKGSKTSFYFFHKRLGFSKLKSFFKAYKNIFVFGQTLIDKVAISSGLNNRFTYDHDGGEAIKKLLKEKKGGILISAHVGNFEIAEYFFSEVDINSQINLVTTDNERRAIKEYLESVSIKSKIKFIVIEPDMSHIFKINNALSNNELICFTGDRYFEGNKTLSENLLGKEAKFPAGPFLLGSRIKAPVIFVYVMKEDNKHYHLFARVAKFKNRDAHDLLKKYTESIEDMLKKYPYQWFNYFDFWGKPSD